MSDREQQQKFSQNANIKSSEFNRLNTNQTEHANFISKGQTLLVPDLDKKTDTASSPYILIYGVSAVTLFFAQWFIGKNFLSKEIYSSTKFLIIVLMVSVLLPEIVIKTVVFLRKEHKKTLNGLTIQGRSCFYLLWRSK